MFRSNTVFVLGAGASWHYGYPTGEQLVQNVSTMADRFSQYCAIRAKGAYPGLPLYIERLCSSPAKKPAEAWEQAKNVSALLARRLRTVKPLLIDFFLDWNPSLRTIGRMMIAAAIFECEEFSIREQANPNRRNLLLQSPVPPDDAELKRHKIQNYNDDWIRFVTHQLVSGWCGSDDLLKNSVKF